MDGRNLRFFVYRALLKDKIINVRICELRESQHFPIVMLYFRTFISLEWNKTRCLDRTPASSEWSLLILLCVKIVKILKWYVWGTTGGERTVLLKLLTQTKRWWRVYLLSSLAQTEDKICTYQTRKLSMVCTHRTGLEPALASARTLIPGTGIAYKAAMLFYAWKP